MPKIDNPVSIIGLNLEDSSLVVESKRGRFLALVDFEQTNYTKERAITIRALEDTKTEYYVLHGRYEINEIREIYRKASIYFVASWESFGLPICELQACGAYVFTPFSSWVWSHWIRNSLDSKTGRLSPNFIVYDNDVDILKTKLRTVQQAYDPHEVRANFVKNHPQFYYGNLKKLAGFVKKLETNVINSQSHLAHEMINELIVDQV